MAGGFQPGERSGLGNPVVTSPPQGQPHWQTPDVEKQVWEHWCVLGAAAMPTVANHGGYNGTTFPLPVGGALRAALPAAQQRGLSTR
jgi:hypothetical protein